MEKPFLSLAIHGLLLLTHISVIAVGSSDQGHHVECKQGELNVILAAPHGGSEKPDVIPDRNAGCFVDSQCVWRHDCGEKDMDRCKAVTVNDFNTLELTKIISENLFNLTGQRPTTVLNLLHRTKLDANRDLDEASFGDPTATLAWHKFQNCINLAKDAIESDGSVSGMGLYIDIHGHGHPNNWAELGFMVRANPLDTLKDAIPPNSSSIYHLSTQVSTPFDDLLRGKNSFGHFLEEEGYDAVPSPNHYSPNGEKYFNGGYNTAVHGSRSGGKVDSIQIESARVNREYPERVSYGRAIAKAVVKFMEINYPKKKGYGYTIVDSDKADSTASGIASSGVVIIICSIWRIFVK